MWLGTDMRILEDYTSRYTFKESIDHQTFRSLCRDHHQWYTQGFKKVWWSILYLKVYLVQLSRICITPLFWCGQLLGYGKDWSYVDSKYMFVFTSLIPSTIWSGHGKEYMWSLEGYWRFNGKTTLQDAHRLGHKTMKSSWGIHCC